MILSPRLCGTRRRFAQRSGYNKRRLSDPQDASHSEAATTEDYLTRRLAPAENPILGDRLDSVSPYRQIHSPA